MTIDHPQDRDRILLSMGGSFQQSVRSAQKYEPEERDRLLATIYRLRAEEVVAHLPMPFVARLVLTTLERLAVDRQARPVAEVTGFEVFLYRSARAAITRSMVAQLQVDPYAMHELDCRLGEPGSEMSVEGLAGRTARVEVSVPFSWALDVWLRGLSVVDGFAVLAAADTPVHEHVAPPDHEHSDHEPMSVAVTVLRWVGRPDGLAHPEAVAAVARRVDDQWSLVSID